MRGGHRIEYRSPPNWPPPSGFDPLTASAEQLEAFWLPDRPDQTREPELFAHWSEMMRAPLFYAPTQQTETLRVETLAAKAVPGESLVGESRNWSGALSVPHSGGRFRRVAGKWVIPVLKPGADPNPAGLKRQGSSMWVGLDGAFPWSRGMPQVGTGHYLEADGSATYYCWFQWWLRDHSSGEQQLKEIKVCSGDEIYVNLSVMSPFEVRVHLVNRTSKTVVVRAMSLATPAPELAIQGASAEWILERPDVSKAGFKKAKTAPLYPLPDYHRMYVSRCATRLDNGARSIFSPRLLRMDEIIPRPSHLVLESVARHRGEKGTGVRLDYRRPI